MNDSTKRESPQTNSYGYFAFISYATEDIVEAWSLKKMLDSYKLPTLLRKEYNKKRNPTYEAFLDKTNIQPGDLRKELKDKLDDSHYLIVVCSPRSAKSYYVKQEIEWFNRNGRENEIFLFIIESDPKNILASYNSAIKDAEERWSERDGEKHEFFGANIKEKGVDRMSFLFRWPIIGPLLQRERAYMQLISKLLILDFKQLWSYQKVRVAERIIAWTIGIILIIAALTYIWWVNQPVDITAHLIEETAHNPHLPALKDATVDLYLEEEMKRDTVRSIDKPATFKNIPHHYLGKTARIHVACKDFYDIDTTMILVPDIVLSISRNPIVYGNIYFRLWDIESEKFLPNISVTVEGKHLVSDNNGIIQTFIPLESQKPVYHISSSVQLQKDSIIMPCSSNEVLFVGR